MFKCCCMKRITLLVSLLIMFGHLFAQDVPKDSVKIEQKVLCSFSLNTIFGLHNYQEGSGEMKYARRTFFPLDVRFYFMNNHLGIGYSNLGSMTSKTLFRGSDYSLPYMSVPAYYRYRHHSMFFLSYHFNLRGIESKKCAPFVEISAGWSNQAGFAALVTTGVQWKLNKNIAINFAGNLRHGLTYLYYGCDFNVGLCIRAVKNEGPKFKPSGSRQSDSAILAIRDLQIASAKQSDSLSIAKQRIVISIGGGFYTGRTQSKFLQRSGEATHDFYIDSNNLQENDFVPVRRFFPVVSLGYIMGKRSVELAGSMISYSHNSFPYYWGSMQIRSTEYAVTLSYNVNDIRDLWNSSAKNKRTTFYTGLRLEFAGKERAISDYFASHPDLDVYRRLNYKFKSKSLSLAVDLGPRWQCSRHVFVKLAAGINLIGFIHGDYSYDSEISERSSTGVPYTIKYRSDSRKYNKLLVPGTTSTFYSNASVMLKIGYAF
jgi:hypothetical protein